MAEQLADVVASLGEEVRTVDILISYDVVRLLSEQLYASPVKAAEELVVNGWDAGATLCSVFVDVNAIGKIAVFDNGCGMTSAQLGDLWHIGVSTKPPLTTPRLQIGKFGIGKLASYAVARRATYVTKSDDGILTVTINFDDLVSRTDRATGIATPLPLTIRKLESIEDLAELESFQAISPMFQINDQSTGTEFSLKDADSWTLVILEELRDRANSLAKTGRLRWVLETAMPYSSDFALNLNGDAVESNKRRYEPIVQFALHEISPKRIVELNASSAEDWQVKDGKLVSRSFPSGVTGNVIVTKQSLYAAGGKSEDLGRSHGFFVRVHKRLINETDPLFGARPLSFTTWYKFAAEVEADDLNPYITAARDDFEQSELKPTLRDLLIVIFNEARERHVALEEKSKEKEKEKTEGNREYVRRRLLEQALADALAKSSDTYDDDEGDDDAWTVVSPLDEAKPLADLISELYDEEKPRRRYSHRSAALGLNQPYVALDPDGAIVTLNEDHILVQEFGLEDAASKRLLELFGVAEGVLEAYMREADIHRETIREILARRDLLLRGLAMDESQSLKAIAQALRDSATNSADSKGLEIAAIGAMRALGFAANHVSGSKTPDGTAGFQVWGVDSVRLTIEAKASNSTPSLNNIDYAGLRSHAVASGASGTLLVAPTYPGIDDPNSEVSLRASQQKISCWTSDQLARVVEAAERRHITARDVQSILLEAYSPLDVQVRVDTLLSSPIHDHRDLYRAVLKALEDLSGRMVDIPRNVFLVAAEVTRRPELGHVTFKDVREALLDIAHASRGLVHLTGDESVLLLGDLDEVRRRVASLTALSEAPRRRGSFRKRDDDADPAGGAAVIPQQAGEPTSPVTRTPTASAPRGSKRRGQRRKR